MFATSVPGEKSQPTEEDRLQVSKGLKAFLSCYYARDVRPEMVNDEIIAAAAAFFESF